MTEGILVPEFDEEKEEEEEEEEEVADYEVEEESH